MGIPMPNQPQQPLDGTRVALKIGLGLGVGLIPAVLAISSFATLCPGGDATCDASARDITGLIQALLFIGAWLAYLVQLVAALVCSIERDTRPIGLGLLIMLAVGPVVTLVGWIYIILLTTPQPADFVALPLGVAIASMIVRGAAV